MEQGFEWTDVLLDLALNIGEEPDKAHISGLEPDGSYYIYDPKLETTQKCEA